MAEITPPYVLQGGVVNHPALLFRRSLAGILSEGIAAFNTPLPFGLSSDLAVSQSGTPGMSVVVARGGGYVRGDDITDQGLYFVYNDANVTLTVPAADATNPRKDIVVAHVYDNFYGQPGDTWALQYIAGTPAGSPVEPALPNSALKLATVSVAALATSIVNANIANQRFRAQAIPIPQATVICSVYQTAANNFTDTVQRSVPFDTELFDSDGFHDTVTNNTRLTIPAGLDGYYKIGGAIGFASGSASGLRQANLMVNGGTSIALSQAHSSSGSNLLSYTLSTVYHLNAGDYVEMFGQQNSGGTLASIAGVGRTQLWLTRLGF